ncbi:hypothetical protein DDV96_01695 [Marixanthomonas spongiae]|uniref:Uncharacterized protein n=2 Tax=Marixanthomonas spongiae TaxID=2174845 RepID=A0A2U0I816_9FLAO|nr:hypothetical protein DDV96_01695 [Marixanthomonas spongiae]
MFKKISILILILFINGSPLFAQKYKGYFESVVEFYTRDLDDYASNNSIKRLSQEDLKRIEGSPYVNKLFIPGNLYKKDSLIATQVPMRYNILSDQIELKDPKSNSPEPQAALLKNADLTVQIYDSNYRYRDDFISEKGVPGSYFEVVWEGKHNSLYKKMEVTYHPPFKAKTTFDNDRPAEFTQNETFYLVNNKGKFTELPTRKSALYKVLGDKKKEVKNYVKKNDLDTDKERDLARLIAYYNSLL